MVTAGVAALWTVWLQRRDDADCLNFKSFPCLLSQAVLQNDDMRLIFQGLPVLGGVLGRVPDTPLAGGVAAWRTVRSPCLSCDRMLLQGGVAADLHTQPHPALSGRGHAACACSCMCMKAG